MNIERVKWSYLNIKKQKLEYKEELKHINDPINGVCNPKKEFPKQLKDNKEPDFFTPNAPIKYATAGGRGVMIGCGIITALYVIGVIVGLCLGYGWSSLLLPFLPFIIIGFIGYIWEMFKKFYNLGYDEKRRI
ncbi:hypothetical protein [Bacteroides sp.]|mgnify:FL=1|uniref:hypothetical protein n=1 Tax=Bacteroides sp. TaxID=29523 RepID=UPI0025808023|nr:hypothetical protein [Bacteroides sp.]